MAQIRAYQAQIGVEMIFFYSNVVERPVKRACFEHKIISNPKFMVGFRSKYLCWSQFFNKVGSWNPIIYQTIYSNMIRFTFHCYLTFFSAHYYYRRATITTNFYIPIFLVYNILLRLLVWLCKPLKNTRWQCSSKSMNQKNLQ